MIWSCVHLQMKARCFVPALYVLRCEKTEGWYLCRLMRIRTAILARKSSGVCCTSLTCLKA
jgi:hypothetical protein